jgi:hypothetical protein
VSPGREHGLIVAAQRPVGEALESGVERGAALHGAVGEALGLGALATVDVTFVRGLAEGALGVGLALEGCPDRLEGEPAGRRDDDSGPRRAHSFGSEWPRR